MTLGPLPEYPWEAVTPYRQLASEHPGGLVDLSVGSPVDPTPEIIRDALVAATDAHAYPATIGSRAARQAICEWFARRRGVPGLTPDNAIVSVGSKEFIAFTAFFLGLGEGDVVVQPVRAYPTYAVGATFAGADVIASNDPAEWPENTKLVWLNSPGNPDGSVLDIAQLRAAVTRARELGAIVCSDECYAELGWDDWATTRIPSLLDPEVTDGDLTNLIAVYSLSKQSNLAGYRAAFAAGDPELIATLGNARKHAGLMMPAPVQHALTVALGDDAHVTEQRERYRERRRALKHALEAWGLRIEHSEAGLYLWGTRGEDAWDTMRALAQLGILAGPGHFYGDSGANYVRVAFTATDADIARAVERLSAAAS